MSKPLPPYASRHLATCAMQSKYPTSNGKVKKLAGDQAENAKLIVGRMRAVQAQLKTLSLELAGLECELKEAIHFNEGVEIPDVGILYWTAERGGRRVKKVDWARLAEDMKISHSKMKAYQREEDPKRSLFLKARAHGPVGTDRLAARMSNDQEIHFDGEL